MCTPPPPAPVHFIWYLGLAGGGVFSLCLSLRCSGLQADRARLSPAKGPALQFCFRAALKRDLQVFTEEGPALSLHGAGLDF